MQRERRREYFLLNFEGLDGGNSRERERGGTRVIFRRIVNYRKSRSFYCQRGRSNLEFPSLSFTLDAHDTRAAP